jgi:AcrR family transcriptional regulator
VAAVWSSSGAAAIVMRWGPLGGFGVWWLRARNLRWCNVADVMATRSTGSPRMAGSQRREQLLDVVASLVAERGFHDVSIEAVARAAGVTRPIVYGHFGDLSGLFHALVDRGEERAVGQLAAVLPQIGAGDNASLVTALRGYLDAVRADPDNWRLILMPPEGAPPALRDRIARGRAAVVAQLAELVAPGFAPGSEVPDPELLAIMLSTLADEAARLVLTDPERFPVERVVRQTRWLLDRLAA